MTVTPSSDTSALIADLQSRLNQFASPRTRTWWEGYLKGAAAFRGVPMGRVRDAVTAWHIAGRLRERSGAEQLEIALALVREPMTEDKLAGILMLQEILLPAGLVDCGVLERFAALFDEGHIADWNVCDWFCVKVLGPLVERHGAPCARTLAEWKGAGSPWRRRAAAVAFVQLAARGDDAFPGLVDLVLDICAATAKHDERFVQTGTAWTLRELSIAAPGRVAAFLQENRDHLSPEALKSAARKLPADIAAGARSGA